MSDEKLEQLRHRLREDHIRHLRTKFLKEHIVHGTVDPTPDELRASIPGILATLEAIDDFKRVLVENDVSADLYPTIAADLMVDGLKHRHPETARQLTNELLDHIEERRAPILRETNHVVALEENFYGDCGPTLLCPHCGGSYLHHCGVTAYDRHEDEEVLTRTEVCEGVAMTRVVPSVGSGNPSVRRDGLAIRFYCELCEATEIELTVEQHKGQTFLGWRYALAETEDR